MVTRIGWTHLILGLAAAAGLSVAVAACASGTASTFGGLDSGEGLDSGGSSADSPFGGPGDGGFGFGDTGTSSGGPYTGALTITPMNPIVPVTIDSMGVHTTPVTFTAQNNGNTVPALWSLDRGELGSIGTSTGIFTASGMGAGVGTVTATAGNLTATTTVVVELLNTQIGAPTGGGLSDGGLGGNGGVGGVPLGGPVAPGVVTMLQAAANPDAGLASGGLTWLYPYDQTVWPQGLLPPLLQWTAPPTAANAVYIHLKQANYEFKGFYSGTNLVNQPIDPTVWKQATNSNGGDALHVEVTLTDGTHVYGPIAENWKVAAGQLKGVVYYSSYNTSLAYPVDGATPAGIAAAILSIRSGSTSPTLAIPGADNKCLVCHEVSADGATLFTSNGMAYPNYNETDVFDLQSGSGTPTQTYASNAMPYSPYAPDGTTNDRKFLWSGLWGWILRPSELPADDRELRRLERPHPRRRDGGHRLARVPSNRRQRHPGPGLRRTDQGRRDPRLLAGRYQGRVQLHLRATGRQRAGAGLRTHARPDGLRVREAARRREPPEPDRGTRLRVAPVLGIAAALHLSGAGAGASRRSGRPAGLRGVARMAA